MRTTPGTLLRAAMIGAAAGGRTTAGPAALALTSSAEGRRARRVLATVALGGELVGDKLPRTPGRDEPAGVIGRAGASLACGAALARRRGEAAVPAAVVGLAGGAAGLHVGLWWRTGQAERIGVPPFVAALMEDAVVLCLVAIACRGT